jgi:hypothetical protein
MAANKPYWTENSLLDQTKSIHKFKSYNPNTLSMISENYIWFATLDSLNDPFEGVISYKKEISIESILFAECAFFTSMSAVDLTDERVREVVDAYNLDNEGFKIQRRLDHIQYFRDQVLSRTENDGFFCALSEPIEGSVEGDNTIDPDLAEKMRIRRNQEDISLWSHYGDGLRGLRISYAPHKIKQIENFSSALVKYQDFPETIDATHEREKRKAYNKELWDELYSQGRFVTKATAWAYEREIRLRTREPGRVDVPYESIEAIAFGSKMPEEQRVEICNAAKLRNPSATFTVAKIDEDEFKIDYIPYQPPV